MTRILPPFFALMLALPMAPALAHHPAEARRDAMTTQVPALTYSLSADRQAAVTYLDDTLSLLEMAAGHLRDGYRDRGRRELMSASGKLTTAYLLMFKDPAFADRVAPLVERTDAAMARIDGDRLAAAAEADALRKDLRGVYRDQLAQLGGGGAGRTLEDLDHRRVR